MSIKRRIEQIERSNAPQGSCKCKPFPKVEFYAQDLTDDAEGAEKRLISDAVPETCEVCRKPVDKQTMVFQLVDVSE